MAPEPEHGPAAAGGAHGSTEAAGHGAGGLPQFDPVWWPGQMVWLLIIFAVLFVLMKTVFVPRVGGTITQREAKIAGDIAEARRLKAQAEAQAAEAAGETAAARARAQKTAAEAKARVKAEAQARQAAEEARLAETMASAEAGIRQAREQAMASVRGIATETAQAIVEKLSGRPASSDEVERALAARA
jgi:F-type H+-transporting ATPase subunit b